MLLLPSCLPGRVPLALLLPRTLPIVDIPSSSPGELPSTGSTRLGSIPARALAAGTGMLEMFRASKVPSPPSRRRYPAPGTPGTPAPLTCAFSGYRQVAKTKSGEGLAAASPRTSPSPMPRLQPVMSTERQRGWAMLPRPRSLRSRRFLSPRGSQPARCGAGPAAPGPPPPRRLPRPAPGQGENGLGERPGKGESALPPPTETRAHPAPGRYPNPFPQTSEPCV